MVEETKKCLALVMMVKNEELRIHVSLESCKDIVDKVIILDTGSTDKTMDIIKDFCEKNHIPLFLTQAPFVDFSVSRNVLLDYADDKADFLLLLDCNDELREGKFLRTFINTYQGNEIGFQCCQQWFCGSQTDKYYNVRLIKTKEEWRFKCPVHEYICSPRHDKNPKLLGKLRQFTIFQDRTKDDDKSFKRFSRDKDILYKEYLKDPHEPRTLFYLAQTYGCLNEHENAYKFYKLRIKEQGFLEEIYQAFYRLGKISWDMLHDWEETFHWYLQAFTFSSRIFVQPRVEPILSISYYYRNVKAWQTSYLFLKRACELSYPDDAGLFVERRCYDYNRWSLMGEVAKNVGEMEVGKLACIRAIASLSHEELINQTDTDKTNLKTYVSNENECNFILEQISQKKDISQFSPNECLPQTSQVSSQGISPKQPKKTVKELTNKQRLQQAILQKRQMRKKQKAKK